MSIEQDDIKTASDKVIALKEKTMRSKQNIKRTGAGRDLEVRLAHAKQLHKSLLGHISRSQKLQMQKLRSVHQKDIMRAMKRPSKHVLIRAESIASELGVKVRRLCRYETMISRASG